MARKVITFLIPSLFLIIFVQSTVDTSFASPSKYHKCFTGASLPTLIGKNAGTAKIAQVGQKGVLTYGPYVTLPAGSYNATLLYKVSSGAGHQVASVDRAVLTKGVAGSNVALIPKEVGANTFIVSFVAPTQLKSSEVRVLDLGLTKLEIDSLCIVQLK